MKCLGKLFGKIHWKYYSNRQLFKNGNEILQFNLNHDSGDEYFTWIKYHGMYSN